MDKNELHDAHVQQVLNRLTEYKDLHPHALIHVRRQNPVSLRIRVIDPDFQGVNRVDRESAIWQALSNLPEEIFTDITMLLLLTPEEVEDSLANWEFEHPIPSLA